MQRISVVGTSGSGKSTLARRIADRLAVPYIELDAIHHRPGWKAMSEKEFRAAVADRITGDTWVVDGNYFGKLGDLVWSRADTVVWFDLPRALVMRQITARTLRRALTRRELWNGNREDLRNMVSLDPQRSVIVWAWQTHTANRERYLTARHAPEYAHLRFVRLGSRRETDAFLGEL
ncbi:AAA family ATPase [Nocardia aurantia]|nr:AAA family ATPase [Nocardia aurantia]